jgi:hypothetical protein
MEFRWLNHLPGIHRASLSMSGPEHGFPLEFLTNGFLSQWNSTFGTPQPTSVPPQSNSLSVPPSSGTPEVPSIQALQSANASLPSSQAIPPQQYSAAPVQSFVTPAMWQESVASVYEGGIKRQWDAR